MMERIKRREFLTSAIAVPFLSVTALISTSPAAEAFGYGRNRRRTINVSCDANSIVFVGPQGVNPDDPINDPGPHPYYGASFVVQGVIYPAGTFDASSISSGLLDDGSPEFSDSVIGKWTCSGWFIGNSKDPARGGILTPTGAFVKTSQIYDLDPDRPSARTVTSDGIELIDQNLPFTRTVTGGTGPHRNSSGQVTQTAIGVNATGLFNFVFEFDYRLHGSLY